MPEATAMADTVRALEALAAAAPDGRVGRRSRGPVRRRRRRPALGGALRANMTPMIDVVFQLLVFFIATTRYAGDERVIAMEVRPRTAEAAAGRAPAAAPGTGALVLSDESLRLEVLADGSVDAGPPLRRRYAPHELGPALAAELRGTSRPKGMFEAAFPIVVAPAAGASWEAAVGALDACVAAGYRNVGFDRAPGPGSGR